MTAMPRDERMGYHRRRIRHSARSVSWILAPLFFLSIVFWLLFNAIVCTTGDASILELRMCSHAHLLPDLFVLLVLLSLGWLLFTLGGYGHELLTGEPAQGGRKALGRMRYARGGYRYLEEEDRAIVSFAREMALWAAALLLCTLVFYSFELAFPLGLLTIAAFMTIVYRIYRRLRGFSPPPGSQPPPVGPESPLGGPETTSAPSTAETQQETNAAYPEKLQQTETDLLQRRSGRGSKIDHIVGFGLSGGGIRSATFCLGVFQGLAEKKLLSKIDYLSTVSGGGYFGAFYGRLFTRKEVESVADVEDILAARAAVAIETTPTAGKLPKGKVFRWLRENGRYLAPSGSGDVLLGLSTMLRNFLAVQLVLATFILMIFIIAQLLRGGLEVMCLNGTQGACEQSWYGLQAFLLDHLPGGKSVIWWSPYTVLVPVAFLFFVIPPGWCYWLVEKPNRDTAGRWIPPFYGWLAVVILSMPGSITGICNHFDLSIGACRFGGMASKSEILTQAFSSPHMALVSIIVLFIALETMVLGLFSGYVPRLIFQKPAPNEKLLYDDERVRLRLSLQLRSMLIMTAGVLALALIDSLAQTVYGATLLDQFRPRLWLTAIFGPLIGLAAFGRSIVSSFGGKSAGKRFSIPQNLIAAAAAFLLLTVLLVTMDAGSYLITWSSHMPLGPRPDWRVTQRVNEAMQVEVTPISAPDSKPQSCPREATGTLIRINADTVTIRTKDGDVDLSIRSSGARETLEAMEIGATVRALYYYDEDRRTIASSFSPATADIASAADQGWRISADNPKPGQFDCGSRRGYADLYPAAAAFLITLIFSFLFGWSWPFLNRSTHQPLYTSRLIRAYLGASNLARLVATGKSVTQPIPGDDIKQEEYWPRFRWLANRSRRDAEKPDTLAKKIHDDEDLLLKKGMPLHLVNVTINETLDARTQVEQRDSKGIGMAIGPAAISVGVVHHLVVAIPDPQGQNPDAVAEVYPPESKDGAYRIFRYLKSPWTRRLEYTGEFLTLGNWTGISGAAFSTSLGWKTSMAFSLLAGLANVRLTYWWNSGVKPFDRFVTRVALAGKRMKQTMASFKKTSPTERDSDSFPESRMSWFRRWLSSAIRWLFAVQSFLIDELLARFHGTGLQWWPLSDGGHFENLGGYELIRRRLPVIVIIDAEADPDYTFEGLSNLVRKVRLDFGAEIRFHTEEQLDKTVHSEIRNNFGTLEQLRRGIWVEEPIDDPILASSNGARKLRRRRSIKPVSPDALSVAHAALAEVFYDHEEKPRSIILYIKPTLIGDESADVHRYHTEHPSFPHESTLDQFFDEAQWESYRKLGEHIALKLFQKLPADAGKLSPYILLEPTTT